MINDFYALTAVYGENRNPVRCAQQEKPWQPKFNSLFRQFERLEAVYGPPIHV